MIFKNRAQNIECSFGCVARSAVLLPTSYSTIFKKKNSFNIVRWRSPLTVTASPLIFEEKWPNYTSGPKSAPNSDLFWVRRLFNVCVRVLCALNATILLHLKRWFFCQNRQKWCRNISQRCSSVYTTIFILRKNKTNYLSNQTRAKCYHSRNKH